MIAASLPSDGLIIFAKRECETCAMVEPVFGELAHSKLQTAVLTQDDPSFPRLGQRPGRHRARAIIPFRRRGCAHRDPPRERQRGGPHIRMEPRRMGARDRLEKSRLGVAGDASRLRIEVARARRLGGARRPLRRQRPRLPPHRDRRMGRRDRSVLRPRLVRRPAGRAADRRAHHAHAEGHLAQARRGDRTACRPISRRSRSRRSRSTP